MKKLISVATITLTLICATTNAQKRGTDFYVLPMIWGEYGVQMDFENENNGAFGLHLTYFNPACGITGIIIQSQVSESDELTLNAHGIIPGLSYTHYTKKGLTGLYYGGLLRYKMALGNITLEETTSGGRYQGMVETDLNIHAVNMSFIIGYRFAFDNNFSLRLGGALGFQHALVDEVTYNVIEQNYDDDAEDIIGDLEDGVDTYTNTFTKPVTFQLMIAIGFTK